MLCARASTAAVTLALAAVLAGAPAAANATDIRGLSGSSLALRAAARTNDGGAVLAGSVRARGVTRPLLARTTFLGTLQPRWGRTGTRVLTKLAGTATAVTTTRDGGAFVAGVLRDHRTFVAAVGPSGTLRRSFGDAGVVRAPAKAAGAAPAITTSGGVVVVAAGVAPCAGCTLLVLNARTGAVRTTQEVVPAAEGIEACPDAAVWALVGDASGVTASGGAGAPASCTPVVVHRSSADGALSVVRPVKGAERVLLGPALPGGRRCEVAQEPAAVRLQSGSRVLRYAARPGRVAQAIATDRAGCSALVMAASGRRVALVGGGARVKAVALPRQAGTQTAYRCRRHLLVIGTRRAGRTNRQAIVTRVAV